MFYYRILMAPNPEYFVFVKTKEEARTREEVLDAAVRQERMSEEDRQAAKSFKELTKEDFEECISGWVPYNEIPEGGFLWHPDNIHVLKKVAARSRGVVGDFTGQRAQGIYPAPKTNAMRIDGGAVSFANAEYVKPADGSLYATWKPGLRFTREELEARIASGTTYDH